ncbi:MAG TPA: GNAT family N-acetyltransferase [Pyrinomonadaceae bacterium]|nr:GNAT family N-acetyltransferase [Pyrinomonadaceae bacterium]
MNEINLKIRRGTIADAETLAPLAVKIFNDAFADNPLNKPEDMRAYIAEAFSLEQTRRELSDENIIFFIAELAGEMVGYAKLQENSKEDCVSDDNPIELSRLYVLKDFHGQGIADRLMNECLDIARRKNYRTMWLGVWEHNFRAQRFYEKFGFIKVGSHVFQLGSDPQIDWVLEKKI